MLRGQGPKASIDIGSNTILLFVAKLYVNVNGLHLEEILDLSTVTGLARNIGQTGEFSPQAMEESFQALSHYRDELSKLGLAPSEAIATATEASRVAQNARPFFQRVQKELGFSVQIITPEGEGFYTARGVMCDSTATAIATTTTAMPPPMVIMDIGGASTELISLEIVPPNYKILSFVSIPIGLLCATEWRKANRFSMLMEEALQSQDLTPFKIKTQGQGQTQNATTFVCVAGAMTSLAAMAQGKGQRTYEAQKIHGMALKKGELQSLLQKCQTMGPEKIREAWPFLGRRSATIVAGGQIALAIANTLKVETFKISTYGLRHGTLVEGGVHEKYVVNPVN